MRLSRAVLRLGGSGRRLSTATAAGGTAAAGGQSTAQLGAIPLAFPAVCMWGSNTGVGKTLFSAGLAAACRRAGLSVLYLKPAQTGFPADSDARLVATAAQLPLAAGPHAAHLLDGSAGHPAAAVERSQLGRSDSSSGSSGGSSDGNSGGSQLAKVLYAWSRPVSPHLAVEMEGRPVSDRRLAAAVASELRSFAAAALQAGTSGSSSSSIAIVETAGGVASPGPSGTLQCDLLRPLRLPGILVGDGRLGGISATLSAYDSLVLRGHSVPLVVLMDGSTSGSGRAGANSEAIQRHLRGKAAVLTFPVCEPPPAGQPSGQQGAIDASLAAWLEASAPQFDRLVQLAGEQHQARLAQLQAAAGDARRMLWWPFTQHASVAGDAGVTVIDGRVGECFSVYRPQAEAAAASKVGGSGDGSAAGSGAAAVGGSLELLYDACASWWTQGVSQEAQPELVRAMSAAAARFGHVMFPENAHEPAVELARELLSTVGGGWADRVFYTDDGSTAVEVALKMAFRKFLADHGLLEDGSTQLEVLGLTEGYHGDTLGAMDAVAPSPFNGRLQTPWYTGRGLFLEPPTVALQQGSWRVSLPDDMVAASNDAAALAAALVPGSRRKPFATQFGSREAVFALEQRMASSSMSGAEAAAAGGGSAAEAGEAATSASLYPFYLRYIQQQLDDYEATQQRRLEATVTSAAGSGLEGPQQQQQPGMRVLGACIVEPVLQGAGGMRLIDPLYQRALVEVCRQRRIPVIFDEVFTGLWRLGAQSGAALLGISPDIACYAKLLTGGTVPLSATLASESVFRAFKGDTKAQALLHGHSYTAHPIGCAAGVASLQLYRDEALNPNWCTPEAPGRCRRQTSGSENGNCCDGPCGHMLSMWDERAAMGLSQHPSVRSVVALGTVLAVQLKPQDGTTGYGSNAAAAVVRRLRSQGVFGRPLGDVVYLMVTPMTARAQCDALLAALAAALD